MYRLNLPSYETKFQEKGGKQLIFDFLRRKYVALTPEEWVRQHFTHYLVEQKGYPRGLMANEMELLARMPSGLKTIPPVDPRFRKPVVKAVMAPMSSALPCSEETEYPSTAIGINLPNAEWIRAQLWFQEGDDRQCDRSSITKPHGGTDFVREFVVDEPDAPAHRPLW